MQPARQERGPYDVLGAGCLCSSMIWHATAPNDMRAAAVAAAATLLACCCVAPALGAAFDVALWRHNSTLDKNVQRAQRNVLCACPRCRDLAACDAVPSAGQASWAFCGGRPPVRGWRAGWGPASPTAWKGRQLTAAGAADYGVISLGSDPQQSNVCFDTGSADLWLPDTSCNTPSCVTHPRFDQGKSKSLKVGPRAPPVAAAPLPLM